MEVEELLQGDVEDLLGVVLEVLEQVELVMERQGEKDEDEKDGSLRRLFLTTKNIS